MACQCADLCPEYGNCTTSEVEGLQNLKPHPGPHPQGVKERYRCPDCGQVWELWMVDNEGTPYPFIMKEGNTPGPLLPE